MTLYRQYKCLEKISTLDLSLLPGDDHYFVCVHVSTNTHMLGECIEVRVQLLRVGSSYLVATLPHTWPAGPVNVYKIIPLSPFSNTM